MMLQYSAAAIGVGSHGLRQLGSTAAAKAPRPLAKTHPAAPAARSACPPGGWPGYANAQPAGPASVRYFLPSMRVSHCASHEQQQQYNAAAVLLAVHGLVPQVLLELHLPAVSIGQQLLLVVQQLLPRAGAVLKAAGRQGQWRVMGGQWGCGGCLLG